MRIAMVVPVAAVPHERARWDELAHRYIPLAHARAQAARGNEVHLFFDGPRECIEDRPGLTIHVLEGLSRTPKPVLRSPHLVRAALATRPDVLHFHHLLALENLAAATFARVPVFAEFHGGGLSRWAVKRRLLRWVSKKVSGSFFPSAAHRAALVRAGAWHRDVRWYVSPETTARSAQRLPRTSAEPGAPRVLVVARAEAPKAPLRMVEVLDHVLERAPGARLRWACPGGRDLLEVERAIRARPRLGARLELGPVPFAQMPATYAWADVVVATSEREIGGTVLSEAFAQGTPFVGDWLPTFDALAGNGRAARLLRDAAPATLAKVVVDVALQEGLRSLARQRFEEALSFDAVARAREEIYARRASQSLG